MNSAMTSLTKARGVGLRAQDVTNLRDGSNVDDISVRNNHEI